MASQVNAEIVKVEKKDRYAEKPMLIVTAKSCWDIEVVFEVPERLASSYTVGRQVNVTIDLVR